MTDTTPTGLAAEQYGRLIAPIHPSRVRQLRGNSHVEAWDIRRTLIRMFGFGGFDIETRSLDLVREIETPPTGQGGKSRWTVVYRAEVRLTIKDPSGRPIAVYEDGATGDSANQPSLGDAHDQAAKTALSQGLKRCAVNLGDQFGLSLYNDGSTDATVLGSLVRPAGWDGAAKAEAVEEAAPVRGGELDDQSQDTGDPVDGEGPQAPVVQIRPQVVRAPRPPRTPKNKIEQAVMQVAQAAANQADADKIRATHKGAEERNVLTADVTGWVHPALLAVVGLRPDAPATDLGQWLAAAETWVRGNGGMTIRNAAEAAGQEGVA